MADCSGVPLRFLLLSADCFSDSAIWRALRFLKTLSSKVSASLCSVTSADQRLLLGCFFFLAGTGARERFYWSALTVSRKFRSQLASAVKIDGPIPTIPLRRSGP